MMEEKTGRVITPEEDLTSHLRDRGWAIEVTGNGREVVTGPQWGAVTLGDDECAEILSLLGYAIEPTLAENEGLFARLYGRDTKRLSVILSGAQIKRLLRADAAERQTGESISCHQR